MQRIVSFDIGIRNMAYCIFDISGTETIAAPLHTPTPTISEWTVINVGELPTTANTHAQHKCTCMTKPTSKTMPTTCNHAAKYADPTNTKYYCMTHAKTSGFLMPKKVHEPSNLKKRKAADLYAFLQTFAPPHPFTKKQDALDFAKTYFETHSLKLLVQPTSQNVKDIDLLTIGRNIKILFDQCPQMSGATHVIIENQISPLANRMKTIQGMVAQYFIMKNPETQIEFISSANKLKGLVPPQKTKNPTPPEIIQVNSTPAEPALGQPPSNCPNSPNRLIADSPAKLDKDKYKRHKSDAIAICRQFLAINPCMTSGGIGTDAMTSRKKDDLADCFLQGIWYLKSRNIITYAENLKINSI